MQFEFIIPGKNADLLDIEAPRNGYFVKKVHQAAEISELLKRAKAASQIKIYYIFDHFDTFFSVIERAETISPSIAIYAFDLLYTTTDKLGQTLASVLQQSSMEVDERKSLLNATKMILYLVTGLVKAIDQVFLASSGSGEKKKGAQKNDVHIHLTNWDEKRTKSLVQLYNVMQLPLEKLWERSIAEESFVTMICDVGYRTLELDFVRHANATDAVFQILGVAIKRYNHALQFPVRIISILRASETAVHPIADGTSLLEEEFGITTLCGLLLKDLLEVVSNEIDDSKTVKHCAMFLMRLSTTALDIIRPHITMLADILLELDAYQLRNTILQIMGDILRIKLSSEDLSSEMKEEREEYLEHIFDHGQDINSYVRSKVLQTWIQIKEDMAIPLAWHNKVLRLTVQRLEDKSAIVRKNAMILIRSFLERNPFSGKLSMEELSKEVEKQQEKLQELREKMLKIEHDWEEVANDAGSIVMDYLAHVDTNGDADIRPAGSPSKQMENHTELVIEYLEKKDYLSALKLVYATDINAESVSSMQMREKCAYYMTLLSTYYFIAHGHKEIKEEFDKQEHTVQFHTDCIDFMKIIQSAMPKILELLSSKTNGDVCEAINFFTLGYQFDVKGTLEGMQKMLSVIWCNEKEKKEAVSAAYKKVLFTTDLQGRQHAAKVVKNLCNFIGEMSIGRYISMEFLVNQWVENDDLDHQIIQILFERCTMKLEDTTEKEAREALQLLVLISRTKPSMAIANRGVIESIAFSERGLSDTVLYGTCLDFLMNINVGDSSGKRLKKDSELVQKICETFQLFFFTKNVINFNEIASKTTQFIYTMVQSPDAVCEDVLCRIFDECRKLFEASEVKMTQESTQLTKNRKIIQLTLPSCILNRLIYTLGMFGLRELIFLDTSVYNNVKYRQELKNMKKNAVNGRANTSIASPALDTSASNALKRITETDEEALVGPTSDDNTAEVINFICEEVLLFKPQSILRKYTTCIADICCNPSQFNDEELFQTAVMSLIRFMCVSSSFCEGNLGLLMNILSGTRNSTVKCNIIIGAADLTFRSPNVTEPWTGHFYNSLHDENTRVRMTTVKMLSYLLMHEMIRVKGQISELALRLVDEDDEIRTSTEEFFKEVSVKSTILYNVMPDIISRLGTNLRSACSAAAESIS
uniref:Condensin complex subunit 1 n=1 Tax=Lutzomyia longipalpis TaxID=7200 RepID=A0A1B0GH99_LUTLO